MPKIDYLTIRQVVARLSVRRTWLQNAIVRGEFPPGQVRWRSDTIASWLEYPSEELQAERARLAESAKDASAKD